MLNTPRVLCAALILAVLPLAGCYAFSGTSLEGMQPGQQARLVLDPEGFGRVANQAAMNGITADRLDMAGRGVIGRVVDSRPETLVVELRGGGSSVFRADVPTRSIQVVQQREFSRNRTLGAVAAGGLVFAALLGSGVVGGSTGGDTPPEPDRLIHWFSIRVP